MRRDLLRVAAILLLELAFMGQKADAAATDDTWSRLSNVCTAGAFLKRNLANTDFECSTTGGPVEAGSMSVDSMTANTINSLESHMGAMDSFVANTDNPDTEITVSTSTPLTGIPRAVLAFRLYSNTLAHAIFLSRFRGTRISSSSVLANDSLWTYGGAGYDGLNSNNLAAAINFRAEQNFSTTERRASIRFFGSNAGAGALQPRARMSAAGNWRFGDDGIATERVEVVGNILTTGTVSAGNVSVSNSGSFSSVVAVSSVQAARFNVTGTAASPPTANQITKESFVRAWVKFVGATATISASYNVASVSRISAGRYLVTFTTPFASIDYILMGTTVETTAGQTGRLLRAGPGVPLTTASAIETVSSAGTPGDAPFVMAAWMGLQ